jgi:hypothetical protein
LLKKKISINPKINNWFLTIDKWKKNYPICPDSYYKSQSVNPYVLVKILSKILKKNGGGGGGAGEINNNELKYIEIKTEALHREKRNNVILKNILYCLKTLTLIFINRLKN